MLQKKQLLEGKSTTLRISKRLLKEILKYKEYDKQPVEMALFNLLAKAENKKRKKDKVG